MYLDRRFEGQHTTFVRYGFGCRSRALRGGCSARREAALPEQSERVAVVSDRCPAVQNGPHRGHQPQGRHGTDPEPQGGILPPETPYGPDGQPDRQCGLDDEWRQAVQIGFAAEGTDRLVHRAVEAAEHLRKGAVEFDVGVSAEGFGYDPGLFPAGTMLRGSVSGDALSDNPLVDCSGGEKHSDGEQCRRRGMKCQRSEQQQEQQSLGCDLDRGTQHPEDECPGEAVDVAGECHGVCGVDKGQSAVVIGDIELPGERAVEIEQAAALETRQPEGRCGLQQREEHRTQTDRSGEEPGRPDSRPGVDCGEGSVAFEGRGIEQQSQQGQQCGQPCKVESGPCEEREDHVQAPAAVTVGQDVEDFFQSVTGSILPRRTYHKNPSVFAYPISRSRRMYSRICWRWLSMSSLPNL